jgi:hypothetical protein
MMRLSVFVAHKFHHEQVGERTEQYQARQYHRTHGDIEKEDRCQGNQWKQAASQHDEDVFLAHADQAPFLTGSFIRRVEDVQIVRFDLGREFIQRARRRAAEHCANEIKVAIMTGADIMLQIRVPGDATTQVSADIGKHPHLACVLADDEYTITIDRLFPSIDSGASEAEWNGGSYRIVFQGTKSDPDLVLRFTKSGTNQISDRGYAENGCHCSSEESHDDFDEIAAV